MDTDTPRFLATCFVVASGFPIGVSVASSSELVLCNIKCQEDRACGVVF